MLVLTSVPVRTPIYPDFCSPFDVLDSVTRHAAHNYALAHARLQAIQHQRQQDHYRRQEQTALLQLHHEIDSVHACSSASAYTPFRYTSAYSEEDFAYSVWREQECRDILLARPQRACALAEAAAREEAERRIQHEQETLRALLDLGAMLTPNGPPPSRRHWQASVPKPPAFVLQPLVSAAAPTQVTTADRKGKGKAAHVPVEPAAAPITSPSPAKLPTFKEELEARIRNESNPEIQESLLVLYSDLFDAPMSRGTQSVAGPSVPKHERQQVPVKDAPSAPSTSAPEPTPAESTISLASSKVQEDTTPAEGANLHRTPALPPAVAAKLLEFYHARRARRLSLTTIKEIEDALRKLEGAFELPEKLDFVNPLVIPADSENEVEEPGPLAYTPNNTPVHAYEHALNALLTRLDEVESNGDLEVRGRRKEVVHEIERALQAMERKVEASRERERERSKERTNRAGVAVSEVEVDESAAIVVEAPAVVVQPSAVVESALVEETVPAEDTSTENTAREVSVLESAPVVESALAVGEGTPIVDESYPILESDPASHLSSIADNLINNELAASSSFTSTPQPQSSDPAVLIGDPGDDTGNIATGFELLAVPQGNDTPVAEPGSESPVVVPSSPSSSEADTHLLIPDIDCPYKSDAEAPSSSSLVSVSVPAPEAISRMASTATDTSDATDATFVTADTFLPPTSVASAPTDDDAFVTAEASPATSVPMTRTSSDASSSSSLTSAGEGTFLLSEISTPLAEDQSKQKPRTSTEDELDIISKEELEVARNDSDWSDVGSEA